MLGFASLMASPNDAMKTLSMFGTIRTFGIMLATVLSGTLVKFGGHALAMMAGNISGQMQSQGDSSAMATHTPEGHANTLRQNWEVMPTQTMANHYSTRDIWNSKTFDQENHLRGNLKNNRKTRICRSSRRSLRISGRQAWGINSCRRHSQC
ncbi:MAG: hypothetical protein M1510_11965 [Nitrospirae bacterium]|nr:hypothetical protein [Nitrospirota bacterium]MCL5237076.1 hypothetical protein [Nitrospirota bacterium]